MTIRGELQWNEGALTGQVASGGSAELNYFLFGDGEIGPDGQQDSREACFIWLVNNAPATFFDLVVDEISVTRRIADNRSSEYTELVWEGSVSYKSPDRQRQPPLSLNPDGSGQVRFHIRSGSGESVNMLYSKRLRQEITATDDYNMRGTLAERMLGLKVDDSEDVGTLFVAEGIPFDLGSIEVVIETVVPKSPQFATILSRALFYANKKVTNALAWRGFGEQELKLVDVSWEQRVGSSADSSANTEPWDVQYRCEFQRTISAAELNANLPPGLPGKTFTIPKRGWEYLDILWGAEVVEAPNNANFKYSIPVAKRAAIHTVHDSINFNSELLI